MILHWIQSNKKRVIQIAVALVIIIIVGIIAHLASIKADPYSGVKDSYNVEDEESDITTLLSTYYNAYANNDMATLESVANPVTDLEKSYVAFMSEYVNEYVVEEVYSKQAMEDDSYLVSVYVLMDFNDLETFAPGLDFFYIRSDDEGNYYIDNTYSTFNQRYEELEFDSEIMALIDEFSRQEDVVALAQRAGDAFNSLNESDENFGTFFNRLTQSLVAWKASYDEQAAAAEAQAQADAEAAAKAEAEAAAKAEEEAKMAEEEANAVEMVATEKIRVRESASTSGSVLGSVDKGTKVKKYADEGDWSKVDYNGKRAYIKSEYLAKPDEVASAENTENQTQNTTQTADANGYKAGDTVTASDILNIREKPDTASTKIGTVMDGDSVKVLEDSGANGWTKIDHRGKIGYIKTEVLR